jgi:hypothetical protein
MDTKTITAGGVDFKLLLLGTFYCAVKIIGVN